MLVNVLSKPAKWFNCVTEKGDYVNVTVVFHIFQMVGYNHIVTIPILAFFDTHTPLPMGARWMDSVTKLMGTALEVMKDLVGDRSFWRRSINVIAKSWC